ncbi:MAG TPA: hypothetical protein VLA43_20020 [Longimicrobiales bacterium]|nr:hypothetical protein [Longimicrobiales bacterium]
MRVTARVLALAVALLVAACDSGPSGPGTLTAVATGNALGGVVLEVRGAGIRGFEARGDARVYTAPVAGEDGVHRVIVITPVPGELPFSIEVDDVGMEGPAVTVISAARGDNYVVPASSVTVRVER